jgi:hypothetical protein
MRLILPIAALACLATPAVAQEPAAPQGQTRQCGTVDEVHTMLTQKYGERIVGNGVASEGQVLMNVYAAVDGKTWSVVMVRAKDGMACIFHEGTDWQTRNDAPAVEGQGS